VVFSRLGDKNAVKELFDVISPKIASRPGGYTRVIKLGKRVGDNAELALIELVDYNDVYGKGIETAETTGKKTRRAGRSKKSAQAKAAPEAKTGVEEQPVPEAKAEAAEAIAEAANDDVEKVNPDENTGEPGEEEKK
jgi:large subunit ribosomal protein L17